MKRQEIEQLLHKSHQETIVLVRKPTDTMGLFCGMKGGYLCDMMTNRRINRTQDFWGYIYYNHDTIPATPEFKSFQ